MFVSNLSNRKSITKRIVLWYISVYDLFKSESFIQFNFSFNLFTRHFLGGKKNKITELVVNDAVSNYWTGCQTSVLSQWVPGLPPQALERMAASKDDLWEYGGCMASYGSFNRNAHESEGGQSGAIMDLKLEAWISNLPGQKHLRIPLKNGSFCDFSHGYAFARLNFFIFRGNQIGHDGMVHPYLEADRRGTEKGDRNGGGPVSVGFQHGDMIYNLSKNWTISFFLNE